jgi:hypothetical protein
MNRTDTIAHLAECAEIIAAHGEPLSDEERREHLCRCAAEDARAEARRRPTELQLELRG